MLSDKQGLSHWERRFPEGRLKGLCCRMHTRCVREHISPATPCPWSTCRHRQSTCWEKAEECAKPWGLRQKAWGGVRCIRAPSSWALCLHLKLKGHCHPGTATLPFCPCTSNGECDWRVPQLSSLKVHETTTKLRAIFQLSNRTVTSSARANGMGQSVQTVLHITIQPLDIICIQQPLLFNSSGVPALYCFWAGNKCYNSGGASHSRLH